MPRSWIWASASGVVGPFAPSAMMRTCWLNLPTLSPVIWFSSAAGIRISTSCSSQASPGNTSYPSSLALSLLIPPKLSVIVEELLQIDSLRLRYV